MGLTDIDSYRENLQIQQNEAAGLGNYVLSTHSDDVIFSLESLKEFIRLIQRQGINNLTIYGVMSELLSDDTGKICTDETKANAKFNSIYTRDTNKQNVEFNWDEIKDKQNYFVIVRYSYAWEDPTYNYMANINNQRHKFIRVANDIIFNPITQTFNNGTFQVTSNQITQTVRLKGFDEDGNYTGVVKQANGDRKKFLRNDGTWSNELENTLKTQGLSPISTNLYDLGTNSLKWQNLYLNNAAAIGGNLTVSGTATFGNILNANSTVNLNGTTNLKNTVPQANNTYDLGSSSAKWANVYATTFQGNATTASKLQTSRKFTINNSTKNFDGSGDVSWSLNDIGAASSDHSHNYVLKTGDTMTGKLKIDNPSQGGYLEFENDKEGGNIRIIGPNNSTAYEIDAYQNSYIRLWTRTNNTIYQLTWTNQGVLTTNQIRNAVFNDYAEYRTTINLTPGHVVIDQDDGSLTCTTQRLQPGAQIISDTFGHSMGETEDAKTPLAVAGRVLAYTYQPRENYHAGMAVCSAPNGTIDIMTREEIKNYPDCIIGIVSEIPQYEEWGTDNVKVNGRIWIKVK